MSACVLIAAIGWTFAVCNLLAVHWLWQARRRAYEYAVARADLTERGCAYSDMATVIVRDGKDPRLGAIRHDKQKET